jgi:phosphatidylglycerol---prolipoprotein diacylglyceryl transferase
MIVVPIDPIIFHVGNFAVRWYALIVMSALFIGLWIAAREAERRGFKKDEIYDSAIWVIAAGVIGARLFHVIDHWGDEFAANPVRVLYIWEGGLAIWGAMIGGLAAILVLVRLRGWQLFPLLDAIAPGMILGQGLGRLACVITGDAVGKPTTSPFGLAYVSPHAMVPQLGVYYTPTPIYEMIVDVSIFALLWRLRKRKFPDGTLFFLYLILYSAGRFIITFWSAYPIVVFGFNQAQLLSLAALTIGLPSLAILWNRMKRDARRAARFSPGG